MTLRVENGENKKPAPMEGRVVWDVLQLAPIGPAPSTIKLVNVANEPITNEEQLFGFRSLEIRFKTEQEAQKHCREIVGADRSGQFVIQKVYVVMSAAAWKVIDKNMIQPKDET